MKKITLKKQQYSIEDIYNLSSDTYNISLSEEFKINSIQSRNFINKKIAGQDSIYGINTGFGKLSSVKIDSKDINKLQENLILSHAVGVGKNIYNRIVRIIILLKVISFVKGNSGIRLQVVEFLFFKYSDNKIFLEIPLFWYKKLSFLSILALI